MINVGLARLLQLEKIKSINEPSLWTEGYEKEYQDLKLDIESKIINTLIIPDMTKNPEEKIGVFINQIITKLSKIYDLEVGHGYGGTLEDWKTTDLRKPNGYLMIFTIKKRELMRKKLSKKWKEFKSTVDDEAQHYRCSDSDGSVGCSHGINDKCSHQCHKVLDYNTKQELE